MQDNVDTGVLNLVAFSGNVEAAYEAGALGDVDPCEKNAIKQLLEQGNFGSEGVCATCVNVFKSMVGAGVLMLPSAFHYSGWLLGSFLLIFSAVVNFHSVQLLSKLTSCFMDFAISNYHLSFDISDSKLI